jgi:hypothetical protein
MSEIIMLVVFAVVIAMFAYRSADNEIWEAEKKAKREAKRKLKQSKTSDEEQIDRPFYRHNKHYAQKNKHAAVTVSHEIDACDSVKALDNVRFLVRDAPLLPIRGCTKSKACDCQYMHHTDRRSIDRRGAVNPDADITVEYRHSTRRNEDKYRRTG